MTKSKMANRYSPEVRARAVRMVFEHQGSYETQAGAIAAIAPKIGCIPQTLSGWVKQAEKDSGMRDGVTTEERDRIETLERENRELRQADEILRKASAYFAQAEQATYGDHNQSLNVYDAGDFGMLVCIEDSSFQNDGKVPYGYFTDEQYNDVPHTPCNLEAMETAFFVGSEYSDALCGQALTHGSDLVQSAA